MKPLVLMVVGRHRSGTSAVAGVLHHLGWHLGPDLMPPSPDNPKGYYESMPLVRLHDAALARAGMCWDTATILGEEWGKSFGARQAYVRARQLLQRAFDGTKSNAVALKDPRMCMFRVLWQAACAAEGAELRVLLVSRNEHAMVQSLCRRDKFKPEHAKAVAERYLVGMNDWAHNVPYGLVTYEGMVEDWRHELGQAFNQLGLPARALGSEYVDAFLDGGLDHGTT